MIDPPAAPNPRMDALEAILPAVCKEMCRKGMTGQKQWGRYISFHPDGSGVTQFRVALRRYARITNPSMRM